MAELAQLSVQWNHGIWSWSSIPRHSFVSESFLPPHGQYKQHDMSIHTAAFEGQLGLVKQLVEQDKKAITTKDEDERQALHWAGTGNNNELAAPFYSRVLPLRYGSYSNDWYWSSMSC